MITALCGAHVHHGDHFESGAVLLSDGDILAIVSEADVPSNAKRHDLTGKMLAPGFIDTQVNGGGGILFNDDPSVAAIEAIGSAHRRYGTTGFLPTLISDDLAVLTKAITAVAEAINRGVPGVLGLHIEGPFLNAKRRGIHNAARLRSLDEGTFDLVTQLDVGCTLITLAPEMTGLAMIRRLVEAGLIVSAGHTDATFEQINNAFSAGVSGMTHLFNAMPPLLGREPGAVGGALADKHVICGVIMDGVHVHPAMLKLALQCLSPRRFMLVTDAMPPVGTSDTMFRLDGRPISVGAGGCVDEDGVLAGSVLNMSEALRNSITLLGMDMTEAINCASAVPADFLRLKNKGRIGPSMAADLVVVNADLRVVETWIGGVCYEGEAYATEKTTRGHQL
jgi:N-acetylglucosamine-6-phosphate deacetylase